MSGDFGYLFAEARKKKGITLEDAAEEVRVKAEYLASIEDESFAFNLPDIYKRGFYKSYAEFLGLDVEDLMAKCPVRPFETLESTQKRREMISQVAKKTQVTNVDGIKTSFSEDFAEGNVADEANHLAAKFDKKAIMKIVGIVASAVAVASVLLYIFVGLFSRAGSTNPSDHVTEADISQLIQKRVVLRVSGDTKIMVRGEEDKEKIFSGVLHKGDEKMISYQKSLQLYFDKGEFLLIELANGEHLHPDAGRGGIQIK